MGNGNPLLGALGAPLGLLLTPHGERELETLPEPQRTQAHS